MNFKEITSLQNPKVKQAVHLRDSRRARERAGGFIFEGRREIERALISGVDLLEIFICPEIVQDIEGQELLSRITETTAQIYQIPRDIYAKIALRKGTEGFVAIAQTHRLQLANLEFTSKPLLLIADNIEKPGNLGAIFRVADSAGVDAVLLTGERLLDLENPNAIRISLGTIFTVPAVVCSSLEAIDFLQENNIQIVTTTPKTDKIYFEADLKRPTAIVMGSEAWGLGEKWLNIDSEKVHLPQKGIADSLNVAMATTIVVYEAVRQRQG